MVMPAVIAPKKHGVVNEKQEIDTFIDDLIAKHSANAEMMNLMALEATSLATSVSSRSKELENQGVLSRLWGSVTGKNQKISARNTHDLAQSQYLGQQMLNKLSENNLMTYQMVVALGDKVNRVVKDVGNVHREIAELNRNLVDFFSKIRFSLEEKFSNFERNDNLLFWKETIEFEIVYKGKTYEQLERHEKVICLANEFYRHSKQGWSSRDVSFLKSIIKSIGHNPDETMSLKEVYSYCLSENKLISQLFKGIDDAPEIENNPMMPTLMAFNKIENLKGDDRYIVETIVRYSSESKRNEIMLDLTCEYVKQNAGRNLEAKMSVFDVTMNIIEDLYMYESNKVIKDKSTVNDHGLSMVGMDTKGDKLGTVKGRDILRMVVLVPDQEKGFFHLDQDIIEELKSRGGIIKDRNRTKQGLTITVEISASGASDFDVVLRNLTGGRGKILTQSFII
ncbi:hypothetical protein L4C36_17515 [Photobacterium japonica]|uniref:hypothetical protein n=1 Tax=Photobacterium japonica TaxID=2910235 RepID=UPI003D1155AB